MEPNRTRPSARTPDELTAPRAFRAFVRAHHPDRGGDPETFRAGLAAFRRTSGPAQDPALVFHRKRRGLAVLTGWWQDRTARRTRPPRVR